MVRKWVAGVANMVENTYYSKELEVFNQSLTVIHIRNSCLISSQLLFITFVLKITILPKELEIA